MTSIGDWAQVPSEDILPDVEESLQSVLHRSLRLRKLPPTPREAAEAARANAPVAPPVIPQPAAEPEPAPYVPPTVPSPGQRTRPPAAEVGLQDVLEHDRLTGLLNRDGFLRQLTQGLAAGVPIAVVQIGLDSFRHLNAALGPDVADLVLTRVADILSWAFAPQPVARVGGDCFAVLLPCSDLPAAALAVRRALDALASADVSIDGAGIQATASAGVAFVNTPGVNARVCLQQSDLAMSRAKLNGRNRVEVHHAKDSAAAAGVRACADRLRWAVENEGLVIHAQPVVGLRGEDEQWELLVRLPLEDGELMSPADFLPVAERFGLAQRIDEWVTRAAVRVIAHHASKGRRVRLEVNVSQDSIGNRSFIEMVEAQVKAAKIDASCLIFEVNGSVAADSVEEVRIFSQRLHDLGCQFALDNFGTSSGALEHLKMLPMDLVKIDGTFVQRLSTSSSDQVIVRSLIELAHGLACKVIAMSVSDEESRHLLLAYGVDFVQGYHIGKPHPLKLAR